MSMVTDAKTLLVRARSILSDPRRWMKEDFIRKQKIGDEDVVSYCALGAVNAAAGVYAEQPPEDALPGWEHATWLANRDRPRPNAEAVNTREFAKEALHRHTPALRGVMTFNDRSTTTHGDILGVFDRAIADLSEQARREGVES